MILPTNTNMCFLMHTQHSNSQDIIHFEFLNTTL